MYTVPMFKITTITGDPQVRLTEHVGEILDHDGKGVTIRTNEGWAYKIDWFDITSIRNDEGRLIELHNCLICDAAVLPAAKNQNVCADHDLS